MNAANLQLFCNRVVEAGTLTRKDLRVLSSEILPYGLSCRDEADLLLALDRTVVSEPDFAGFLISEIVDFVVWTSRPTGVVDAELGAWLAMSIAGRTGPTPTGARIAREVIREADSTDDALIAFALQANGWADRSSEVRPTLVAKAA